MDELTRPAEISEMFLRDWEQQQDQSRERQLNVGSLPMSERMGRGYIINLNSPHRL